MLDGHGQPLDLDEQLAISLDRLVIPPSYLRERDEPRLAPSVPGDNRRFPRLRVRRDVVLETRSTLRAFPRPHESHRVRLLDLSKGGLGFLHSEALFPCERARLLLVDGRWRAIKIVCARRLDANCHLVGAQFIRDDANALD